MQKKKFRRGRVVPDFPVDGHIYKFNMQKGPQYITSIWKKGPQYIVQYGKRSTIH